MDRSLSTISIALARLAGYQSTPPITRTMDETTRCTKSAGKLACKGTCAIPCALKVLAIDIERPRPGFVRSEKPLMAMATLSDIYALLDEAAARLKQSFR